VISNVKKVIPERVQTWWHEYRQAAKEVTRQRTGETEELEIIGHGVAEAEQRRKQDGASECHGYGYLVSFRSSTLTPDLAQAWRRNLRWHTPSTRASSLFASL
jgi:hypothetical protein